MTRFNEGTMASTRSFNEIPGVSCENPPRALMWEYECQACKITFETQVPRGPGEERRIRCSRCDSAKIKRVNIVKLSEPKCGG